jgi:hypothetical protein
MHYDLEVALAVLVFADLAQSLLLALFNSLNLAHVFRFVLARV